MLGDVFIENFYSIFELGDRSQPRVGLALAVTAQGIVSSHEIDTTESSIAMALVLAAGVFTLVCFYIVSVRRKRAQKRNKSEL